MSSTRSAPDNRSIKSQTSLKSSPAGFKPKNSSSQNRRENGLRCYGFLKDNGEFDAQLFTSKKHAYIAGTVIAGTRQEGTFVNCEKEASWLCVSTFKGAKAGRTEGNISHMLCCFLDLDGNPEILITEDAVIQRCHLLGLPLPLIIETSPNRYHAKWYYKAPLSAGQLEYWKLVQQALHGAFLDLGSDPKALDAVRFLRNENNSKSVVREKGYRCSLSQIYRCLKRHGYIRQKRRMSIEEVKRRLRHFLRMNNNTHVANYPELSVRLNVCERSLKQARWEMVNDGELETSFDGYSTNRKTQFTLKVKVHKEIFNSCSVGSFPVLDSFSSQGARSDTRNYAVFASCLELKVKKSLKISFSEAVALLEPGFLLSDPDPVFSRREFEGCIRSALREKYSFPYSKRKLIALGLINCECEKVSVGDNEKVVLKGNTKLGLPQVAIGLREKELLDSHLDRIRKMNLERGFR